MDELPFFASESRLPSPLPPSEVIESSGEVIKESSGRRIIRFNKFYVIKHGLKVSLTEGQNMLFVRRTTSIPVPEVFALFSKKDDAGRSVKYIIMENIPGCSLDTAWTRLDSTDKVKISNQIRAHLDILRGIPAPGYFGCIGRKPFEDSIFWTAPGDNVEDGIISGPFDSESKLNDALVLKYVYNSGLNFKANYYRRVLPLVLRNHKAVFTHGDLQRKNVALAEDGTVVLIDWENAGWFPEYWEYATAMFACGAWQDDWHEYVGRILAEYPNEYAWFDMFARELWS
ncbi:phosphotransferase enzyme family protein [Moelleriella libera RCEF 2490]|uniref:Phosphotransferase enzyme family protein n=1 Tax=Moelleriella libera RCEF 2490 TaxID=1081109 RepID=A0A162I8G1_9HYPO|nr:phosphotransferase enzyme family protein [Moelleriella libera RCEF 2490]